MIVRGTRSHDGRLISPLKQRRLLLVIWITGIAFATTAYSRVVGEDGRRPPGPEDSDLLSAMGRIVCSSVIDNQRRYSAGTGTVVGSRSTILSSAHVFTDEAGRRGPKVQFDVLNDCVFRQYDDAGDVIVEVSFSHAEMGEYWRNSGVPNQDWAVLRTTVPLPSSTTPLPFAINRNTIDDLSGLPVRMLAFHADIEAGRRSPLVSDGDLFGIDYAGYRRLAHTADSGRMSSGAALVYRTEDGQHVVVGVNRSSANLRDFNLAVPISAELEQVLKGYAYGQVPAPRERLARLRSEDTVLRMRSTGFRAPAD